MQKLMIMIHKQNMQHPLAGPNIQLLDTHTEIVGSNQGNKALH